MKIRPRRTKKVSEILNKLSLSSNKGVAWLIDPDEFDFEKLEKDFFWQISQAELDLIFIGGSQGHISNVDELISALQKELPSIPKVIFPGSELQISEQADGLLFLSLLSGRNPEYLIGQQVKAVEKLRSSQLEILSTAYLLVNDGDICSVHRKSETFPLLNQDIDQVVNTALAGKYLGMRYFYLDAGSGSDSTVSTEVIKAVKSAVNRPLIIGGGLDSLEKVQRCFDADADLIVIGNQAQKNPDFLIEVLDYKRFYNAALHIDE
jgi:putative glycerol-1-phosphate prenyltransferase